MSPSSPCVAILVYPQQTGGAPARSLPLNLVYPRKR
jgi:hypothetical protein